MKICFCVDGLTSGGAERVISILSNQLSREHDVSIILVSSTAPIFYKISDKINLYRVCNKKRLNPLKRVIVLRKIINSIKPDVVISFLPHINIYTHFALIGKKCKHVVSERNDPTKECKNKLHAILRNYVFKKADGCVFQTEDAKNYFGVDKLKASTIIFNPIILNSDILDLKPENKVLFVGRLQRQKNIPCLLKSFQIFLLDNPDFMLDVYGDGNDKEKLEIKKYAEILGIKNHVNFLGVSTTWHKEIKKYKCFVMTSDFEGMPNSLLEAAAIGINCVSTDCPVGGPKEISNIFGNVLLANVGDYEEIAKLLSISTKKSSSFSVEKLSLFSPENISKEWIKFIKEL